jgi:hypothetical protein
MTVMRTRISTAGTALLVLWSGLVPCAAAAAAAQEPEAMVGVTAIPGPPAAAGTPHAVRAADKAALAARWGIEIQGLYLTAAGYMLDFRYRVLDPEKAAPLFERRFKPVLTDERTGAVMAVPVPPKTGALRSSNAPQAGRTYFMFFANPGKFVARHSRVTVTIGEFSVGGLSVK